MTNISVEHTTVKHLVPCRRALREALVDNDAGAIEDALRKLLQVELSLKFKCDQIPITSIIGTNIRTPSNWDQVSKALGILERYATNLLKPEDQRPKGWEAIMTKSEIFIKRIYPIVGASEILNIIGYRGKTDESLELAGEPNTNQLQQVWVDLKIAKCEMDLYQNKSHPFPHRLDELVEEEARIAQDPNKQNLVSRALLPTETSSNSISPSCSQSSRKTLVTPANSLDSPCVRPEPSAPPLYPNLPTAGENLSKNVSVLSSADGGQEPREQVWPGTQIKIPSSAAGLLSETDPARRFQNLESIITSLDLEIQQFDEQIEQILVADENFRENKNYQKITQRTSALRREWILLNRVRQDVTNLEANSEMRVVPAMRPATSGVDRFPVLPGIRSDNHRTSDHEDSRRRQAWPDTMKWACQHCTSHNPMALTVCQVCSKTADVKVKVQGQDGFHTSNEGGKEYIVIDADGVRRYQNLESIITALDIEAQKLNQQIDQILAEERDYINNDYYQKLTQRKDDLQREILLLKRNRQEVHPADVPSGSRFCLQDDAKQLSELDQLTSASPGLQHFPVLPGIKKQRRPEHESWRHQSDVRQNERSGVWACQHCTFHNSLKLNICDVCFKTADVKTRVDYINESCEGQSETCGPVEHCTASSGILPEPDLSGLQHWSVLPSIEVGGTKSNHQSNAGEDEPRSERKDSTRVRTCQHCGCTYHRGIRHACSKTADSKLEDSPGKQSAQGPEVFSQPTSDEHQEPPPMNKIQVLEWLKLCDEKGYALRQLMFALEATKDSPRRLDPVEWLDTNWSLTVALVETGLQEYSELGKFSQREIETALEESETSRINVIVDQCRNTRKTLVESLVKTYSSLQLEEILTLLTTHQGSEYDTCRALNELVMRPLVVELETSEERRLDNHELKEIIAKSELDREARLTVLMVERDLNDRVAGYVLAIVGESLLDPDDTTDDLTLAEIIEAASSCSSLDWTLDHLQKWCPTCLTLYPESRMRCMFVCECRMCMECLLSYYRIKVREEPAIDFYCPICRRPDVLEGELEPAYVHFQMLDNLLREFLDQEDYEKYQNKVLQWQWCRDPNFRWCHQCGGGFLVDAEVIKNRQRIACPHCGALACPKCKKKWEAAHDGISCEAFAQWQQDNNPDTNQLATESMLREDGLDCPKCHTRFLLSRGGCQHLPCTACKFGFCSSCKTAINTTCEKFGDACRSKGLHGHHPRNCYTNLRDYSCETLIKLLEDNEHPVRDTLPKQDADHCAIPEQKELADGGSIRLVDEVCGKELYAGTERCEKHYKEYLGKMISRYQIDPVVIMDEGALKGHLIENQIQIPELENMSASETEQTLKQLVQNAIPLIHQATSLYKDSEHEISSSKQI